MTEEKIAALAEQYGWQLAFALDWAQRQDKKFADETELVCGYLTDIGFDLRFIKAQRLACELVRQMITVRQNEECNGRNSL